MKPMLAAVAIAGQALAAVAMFLLINLVKRSQ